jgi:NADH-quinone oxidoreductase subunit E
MDPETVNKVEFAPESLDLIENIISRYPEGKQKSALLPVLHIAQAEFGGWLSVETMDLVATTLKLKPIEVYEVATFYTMFNLHPVGNCVIEVCRTGPCCLNGAGEIIAYLEKTLQIKAGETTPDGRFTLKTVECLAACGNAPVMQVGTRYYENLSVDKINDFLQQWPEDEGKSYQNPYQ